MSQDGKYIFCGVGTPDCQGPQEVPRVCCLTRVRGEVCDTCPGSQFIVRLQIGIGRHQVACPRWRSEDDRQARRIPRDYVLLRRDVCLNDRPFLFCPSCPNSDPRKPPQTQPGWWEEARDQEPEPEDDE